MVFSLLVLLNLLEFAAACRYSLRNRGSSRNSSQTHERRWTSFGPPRQPWPQDSDSPFHSIPICYADFDTWDDLGGAVDAARKMWTDKLGDPGQANGHALRIVEPEFGIDESYCYKLVGADNMETYVWNTKFDPATVVIRSGDVNRDGAAATPGYTPGTEPGRHDIIINLHDPDSPFSHKSIAHELGHVFGLEHEHARHDRDSYVHFECKNLEGYNKALEAIKVAGNKDTIEEVCEYEDLAQKYNFFAADQFAKFKSSLGSQRDPIRGPFNVGSIMIYDSITLIEQSKDRNSFKNWPLAKWKNPDQDPLPTERTAHNCEQITTRWEVTDGDRDGIKSLYPWPEIQG